MKSKRTLLLVLTTAIILSAKPVFAAETCNNSNSNNTNISTSTKEVNADKLAAISAKDKAKITQDQAKDTAKNILRDYFEINIDDTKFQNNVNFNANYVNGIKISVWDIHWNTQDGDKQIGINVSIDANTGKVVRVNRYEFDNKQSTPIIAKITPEQAKEIGEAFLKKINPQEFKESTPVKEDTSVNYFGPSDYSFTYNRTINSIPFESNYIRVGVDGVTGKVISYEITWDSDVKVANNDKSIKQEQAEDIFNNNTKMDLNYNSYIDKYNGRQESKTKLVYGVDSSSPIIIDAVSGKSLSWNGEIIESVKTRNISDNQKEDIFKNAKPSKKLDSPISSTRAEQLIKDKIKDIYGDGYEINSVNYEENGYAYGGKELKVWSADFVKKGKSNNFGPPEGRISINTLTEELVRADRFNFNDEEEENFQSKLTWEQAYDKAIQFIAKNCPEKIKDINTEQKNLTNQNYMFMGPSAKKFISFDFGRVVNGVTFNTNAISYNNDGINVTLDCKTGEINSFGCMWQDKLDLPPAANTISNDEAKKVFLNTNKPQLTYLLFNNGNNMDKSNSKIQLVYYVGHNRPLNTIDAFTGKALNLFGENVDDNADAFKAKIKGSSVEKEALILASQGIIDTKDFKLDSGITRLQLVKVLVNAKGFNPYLRGIDDVSFTSGVGAKDSTDYRYIQLGVKYGIIEDKKDEFKGNELVTREELSKSLIKLLGYDRIAETKGLLNLPYSDSNTISADKTGYVSLAGGLKVIEPNNEGKIRPKDNVTMSELIKAVYISLGTIQK
ncbi:YcdB/YcdC domain-containing protein [Clostridium aciditolerans]|uniref:S-layer homology domain-containing protein n=1 Tax=Clostridium aciditolerans TaxID=339861 RepID=A0A934HS79_9CLOT|nr:YcdB/YcdC domain-containing protein [Clostridium aciditolerans]MBI6872343.1 S-layer homology domain-containing protein [Clostridium aciditolerans]